MPGSHSNNFTCCLAILVGVLAMFVPKVGKAQEPDTSRKVAIAAYPIVFFSPETSLAFGAGGVWTIRNDTIDGLLRRTNLQGYAVYTLNEQVLLQLPYQLFLKKWFLSGEVDYFKFPYKFHGLGDSIVTNKFEWYDARFMRLGLNAYRRIGRGFYVGPKVWVNSFFSLNPDPGTTIERNLVVGGNGGTSSGAGFGILLDRRNDLFYTTKGTYAELSYLYHDQFSGSEFVYTDLRLDLRKYVPFKGRTVLSFQSSLAFQFGNVPFHQLARMGGHRYLRGYFEGLYRDRNLISVQAEYKKFFLPRWGFAAFAGAGTVWGARSWGTVLPAAGGGIRFILDRKQNVNVRVDYAHGDGTSGVYITVLEAF